MAKKVLVLEDELQIREFVIINLKRAGYEIIEAKTGEEAVEILDKNIKIDIAILDIMLPGIDGFTVCKKIRETDKKMGIILLTAKSQEMDKVMGFNMGADDYVVKPFSPMELLARVDALARRLDLLSGTEEIKELNAGPFRVDLKGQIIFKDEKEIELTQIEYAIVLLLMKNEGKSLNREYILDQVWGDNYYGSSKIVDVNIRRIRQKIEEDDSDPKFIKTIWGYGYRWRKDENSEEGD